VAGDEENNTFFFLGTAGQNQTDTFPGRGGADPIDFSRFFCAVWVDLAYAGGAQVQTQFSTAVFQPPWFNLANLSGMEHATGTIYADFLAGDGFSNRLEGGRGPDTLFGRGGADQFVFNLSAAEVQSSAQRDTIQDFVAGTDKVGIEGLTALPNIVIGAAPAPGSTSRALLYNTTSGVLSYDADGTLAGAAVEIAFLAGAPALTAGDFILV
jgi:Ca2+-binding RTX toxin-like protein